MAQVFDSRPVIKSNDNVKTSYDTELHFCISGKYCSGRFCVCDLINIDIKKYLDLPLVICDRCLRGLQTSYEIFAGRVKGLRNDFFQEYLVVKTASMFYNINAAIDSYGCGCGRVNCKINDCNVKERDMIHKNFNLLYAAFAFHILPTDTRDDTYRWLGYMQKP